jgi:Cd2+/Zn2+-exporting ATPase
VTLAAVVAIVPPLLLGQSFWNLPDGQHGWLYRALTMLVIACPCALVISTPVSIVSALTHAARRGILIKGGAYLEAASQLRAVAFDKTGTLTVGKPHVTDIVVNPAADVDSVDLLALAAAVESRSEHPLAQAIVSEAIVQGIPVIPARHFQALSGRGAQAQVNGTTILLGNSGLFRARAIDLPSELMAALARLEEAGKTVTVVGRAGAQSTALGLLAVADTMRPTAQAAVSDLAHVGIEHTVLLTGDNERTAQAVARQAGVGGVRANLQPADKVAAVEALLHEYGAVAMVGDGINDAPALARATVGIAMGGIGTDQALETADVVLMADDLHQVAYTIALSQRARRIVQQNIVFSLGIKVVFMALALMGAATLWMAVFADMGASLLVILNGMRLLRR